MLFKEHLFKDSFASLKFAALDTCLKNPNAHKYRENPAKKGNKHIQEEGYADKHYMDVLYIMRLC